MAAAGPAWTAMSQRDAVRLANQATFGPNEGFISRLRPQTAATWVQWHMSQPQISRYTSGGSSIIHVGVGGDGFCEKGPYAGPNCWRDWYSSQPLVWDFYRNATTQSDQLRQRVAFALQQIVVVSSLEVDGTYGLRRYYNDLLANAFGNYRTVLRKVALSPVMGEYLDNVNNSREAPNENFARELLQLFAIGTCELEQTGQLKGGKCTATYNNEMVRNYAYALTGWTYPPGGSTVWGCWPEGANCTFMDGDMAPFPAQHDSQDRPLLGGLRKAANSTPAQALDAVLDSLMAHPNMAPFIGKQLIQAMVTSNPSATYVQRVSAAFTSGKFVAEGKTFGKGVRGDLAATVAAVLLDPEARGDSPASFNAGKLREPVLMMTGVLRALNGRSDGEALGWWWGESLRQHMFRSPSVFNFYPPDYPVPGTSLVGPAFGIHNANTALERMNFLTYTLDWNGSNPEASVPGALGTKVDLSAFAADAADSAKLVDRIATLAIGQPLPPGPRAQAITAVNFWDATTSSDNWRNERVRAAAYLVFGSPQYQIVR